MQPIAIARRAIWGGVISLGLGGLPACGDDRPTSEHRTAGTITIPLTATVAGGTYHLDAVIIISGEGANRTLTTTGSEPLLSATLPVGTYDAILQSFTLSKDAGNGNFQPVGATVVASRQTFTIFADSTTTISFQFETDGILVAPGPGSLNVTWNVTERPDACTLFGQDCPDGFWCAPPTLTGEPLACIPAGTVPEGDACTSPLECAAQATCHDFGRGPVCAALCAPSEFGAPCTTGGTCLKVDQSFGLCSPELPCDPISVNAEARTVTSARFFLDFSNVVSGDPEDVDVLQWAGGPNLVESSAVDACSSGIVEYFGNSWVPPDPEAGGQVLVGSGSTGSWQKDGASILIHSTSSGCAQSKTVPVQTRYAFRAGIAEDTIEVERQFEFGSTPLDQPFRPFIPRLTGAFDRVLHPDATGTTLRSETVSDCSGGCQRSDWDGTWFAYFASNGALAGQGVIVRREASATAANLWIDDDATITTTNASSVLLLPPAGGFQQRVSEKELLCFFDARTWTSAQQAALELPAGCRLELACNPGAACDSQPCQHGGTCTDVPPGDYTCSCPPGINGKNCDIVFDHLEAGLSDTCGIRSDGRMVCWGDDSYSGRWDPADTFETLGMSAAALAAVHSGGVGEVWSNGGESINQPTDVGFTSLALSGDYGCGVLPNGGIGCFGSYSLFFEPPPAGTYRAVSLGNSHNCAVRTDGTATCWGLRGGIPSSLDFGQTVAPAGTFSTVRSGETASCGLRTDGTIACWGARSDGVPLVPPAGTFIALDFKSNYGCGIRSDHTLACWGIGGFGPETAPPSGTYRSIATGYYHPCAVATDDHVVCWGVFSGPDWEQPPTGQP